MYISVTVYLFGELSTLQPKKWHAIKRIAGTLRKLFCFFTILTTHQKKKKKKWGNKEMLPTQLKLGRTENGAHSFDMLIVSKLWPSELNEAIGLEWHLMWGTLREDEQSEWIWAGGGCKGSLRKAHCLWLMKLFKLCISWSTTKI